MTNVANGTERHTKWNAINWRKAHRQVRNLRQRIYRASQRNDLKRVRSLQKLMLRSYSNTCVSVRRVTQVNAGKYTPGVDDMVVKTPKERGRLVDRIMTFQPWKAKPARRTYVPKANGKKRPLGIPVIIDRSLQAKVKNALEPFWEARFEGSSYGFRPGRSCHDAIAKIHLLARPNKTKKWVLDADITGAFDHINHDFLLQTIGECPGRELIKQWLKAGYMEDKRLCETPEGTPQGGVISPLLANIALHGMEDALGVKYLIRRGNIISKRAVVRYADDFVAFCETQEDAEKAKQILTEWLAKRGLTLSEEKTQIVHLTEGFNFLGFNVRQYKDRRTRTGYKLLIKPSKESVQRLRNKLRENWLKMKGKPVKAVIKKLNPIIRGWANYFRKGVASKTFSNLDRWMYWREIRYAKRTHSNKPMYWRKARYWGKLNPQREENYVFGDKKTGKYLLKFSWFKIERHVLVESTASPDDSKLRDYWKARKEKESSNLTDGKRKIANNQDHVCPVCGESLYDGEKLNIHHRKPKSQGGKDEYSNLSMLHLYCHQQTHLIKKGGMIPLSNPKQIKNLGVIRQKQ